jgi:ABC-type oligopeptide transport system ATPase subunit
MGVSSICNPVQAIFNDFQLCRKEHIILIGSHGTGKSTLAEFLHLITGNVVVESVARIMRPVLKDMTDEMAQRHLFNTALWDFKRWVDVDTIMTRSPLDPIAYTFAAFRATPDHEDFENMMQEFIDTVKGDELAMHIIRNSYWVYVPIEFGLENDGVRPTDVEWQKFVDMGMRMLMKEFGIQPITVSGSVQERAKTVLLEIDKSLTQEELNELIGDLGLDDEEADEEDD